MSAEIKLYGKPNCVQCDATEAKLKKLGLEYEKIDVTEDAEALDYVMDKGFSQAPVVECRDMIWSGYSPDRLNKLAVLLAEMPDNSHLEADAVAYLAGAES